MNFQFPESGYPVIEKIPGLPVGDDGFCNGHLQHSAVTVEITSKPVDDFLDVDFERGRGRRKRRLAGCGGIRSGDRRISQLAGVCTFNDGFTPRIRRKIGAVETILRRQITGQRCRPASEGHDVEFDVILPIGRFTGKLFHVRAQDGIDVTVRTDQHNFDGRRLLGTAVPAARRQLMRLSREKNTVSDATQGKQGIGSFADSTKYPLRDGRLMEQQLARRNIKHGITLSYVTRGNKQFMEILFVPVLRRLIHF